MPESVVTIRRFNEPDDVREFPLGGFELVQLGGMTVGRAEYEPGWRWSEHVGAARASAAATSRTSASWVSGRNRIEMDRRPSPSRSVPATCSRSDRAMTQSSLATNRT